MNKTNILLVGNGGREYAIALHLRNDNRINHIYFFPGNGATHTLGSNVDFASYDEVLDFAKTHVDMVIIGGETHIVAGLADVLRNGGVKVFAPSQNAARLEGSKAFMKDFLHANHIPTARYIQTSNKQEALKFMQTLTPPIVIKASGLCAGKGVIIASSYEEAEQSIASMLSGESFGEAGKCIVIEEFLEGFELSIFAISDGENFIMLPPCQDHKRLLDDDKGPNTGGMGAYAPTPLCDDALLESIKQSIIAPTIKGMDAMGASFCGVLFAGVMVCKSADNTLKPYVLEFNVRFGDPECEVLMPLLQTPLLDICEAVEQRSIHTLPITFKKGFCVAIVLASKEYPYANATPTPICIEEFDKDLGHICYAGVAQSAQAQTRIYSTITSNINNHAHSNTHIKQEPILLASGGRVMLAIGQADTLKQAQKNAYLIAKSIHFSGKHMRKDIATKAICTPSSSA